MKHDLSRGPVVLGMAIAIAVALLGSSFASMYSTRGRSDRFRKPTLALLRAGLAQDSPAIAGMDVSPAAMQWVLAVGRRDPELLKAMVAGLEGSGSRRNRDRAEVTFDVKGLTRCGPWPLTVYFSGLPSAARIEDVQTGCEPR